MREIWGVEGLGFLKREKEDKEEKERFGKEGAPWRIREMQGEVQFLFPWFDNDLAKLPFMLAVIIIRDSF